MAVMIKTLHY